MALEPTILELVRWGEQFMDKREPGDRLDLAWPLLTLKGRYRGGGSMRVAIQCEGREFELVLLPDRLLVQEKEGSASDLVLRGSALALATFLSEGKVVEGFCPPEQEPLLRRLAALLHAGPNGVGDQLVAQAAVTSAGNKEQP
jgi:hypothetical protein